MASPSICRSCLQSLRLNRPSRPTPRIISTYILQKPLSPPSISTRNFTTTTPRPANPPPAPIRDFAATLRKQESLRSTTEPLVAYGVTETLYLECSKQCTYTIPAAIAEPRTEPPRTSDGEDLGEGQGWWFAPKAASGLGLDVTFSTWAQVMFLHMYMLTVRLRVFPEAQAGIWQKNLVEHFFYAAEDRMAVWHGMDSRGVRNRYLKDLWLQWRGVLISYDEGLIKGDAVLAAAVWRNVFKAKREVDVVDVALVTAYMRREMNRLEKIRDDKIAQAEVKFGTPEEVRKLLDTPSPWMNKSFTKDDLSAVEQKA